jgi:hypothetical protein
MSTFHTRYAFALVGFLAAGIAAPLAPALAAPAPSPNMIDNSTADVGMGQAPVAGVYDGYDGFRNANGFPQPGWDYLFFPPS